MEGNTLQASRPCSMGTGTDTKQVNRIENSKIHPHKYREMIFDKSTKVMDERVFQQMVLEKLHIHSHRKKKKNTLTYTSCLTRNRFKCKHKTIKLLEETIGENLQDLGLGEQLDLPPKSPFITEKT